MENSRSAAYAAAGVDITAGYEGVKLMRDDVKRTRIPGVVSDIGGFGGLFAPNVTGMSEPVLVSGTDGVGTKLRLAELMGKHDTIGIDCVAMCVNDVICCGAKPLFFLDYIAIGKNVPEKVASIVSGVAEGCVQAGCALIGGETAEHPGTMKPDDYDLAGFAVGVVDRGKILDKNKMQPGDVVIALPSSGLHSNGYSLVRKVFDVENADLGEYYDELGSTLGECLLTPTRIYVKSILARQTPMSVLCKQPSKPPISAASVTSPAAASMRTFRAAFPTACARRLKRKRCASRRSSPCSRAWAASRSAICSTPSTWAQAWCLSLQRTAPTRRSPRCILSVRRPASSVRSYWTRKRWSYADTRPHRRAGLRRRHEFAGAARRTA